jgi:hypothetical protein
MKNLIKYLLITIAFIACNNDDKPSNPIDQLPPATQVGANKIGCLVNGVPFTDSGLMNNFYQLVDGEYYLVINWTDGPNNNYRDGQIALKRIIVEENQSYILNKSTFFDGDYTGGGATFTSNRTELYGQYVTKVEYFGIVTFTKFDTQNQIMSGTFEFQVQEITTGEIINITDGRFDLTFSN